MLFLRENFKKISLTAILVLAISFCAASSAQAAASQGKHIDISLAKQTLTLYNDGKAVGSYRISSGKKAMPTPKGNFQIYNKAPRPWSAEYELFMPYWMAFTPSGSHGIHELPEWPNGKKEGAGHLGIPVSHGCVRLGVGAAKTVYSWAPVGTPVNIH